MAAVSTPELLDEVQQIIARPDGVTMQTHRARQQVAAIREAARQSAVSATNAAILADMCANVDTLPTAD